MSAEAERAIVPTEFQHQLLNLKQLQESIAATDERIAVIREVIRGFGCRSVAQALEGPPACDDSAAPHSSDSPPARTAGLLPRVLVVTVIAIPTLLIPLSSLKSPASNNRSPDVRLASSEPVTTAISPRDNQQPLPDVPDTGRDLRQPELSIVAPSQEATISMAIRSTLPPSEDDPLPVAPPAAPPPVATPVMVDTTVTFPTPLLDLSQVEDAKRVQRRLIELGFLFGTADGNWGPRSLKALRDFRSTQGIGNSDTWEKTQQDLFSAAAARAPAPGTFVGGWGINADQCRLDNRSRLTIGTHRAEAFSTTCQFNSTQRESPNEWRIRAACANEHDQWNANIRLTLDGSRLTWTSERGTTTYLRCPVIWN